MAMFYHPAVQLFSHPHLPREKNLNFSCELFLVQLGIGGDIYIYIYIFLLPPSHADVQLGDPPVLASECIPPG